jgi:hypothetical protein
MSDSTDLEQLWSEFVKQHPDRKIRRLLSQLFGVNPETVSAWMKGERRFVGETRVKLMVFQQLIGERVAGFSELPRKRRELAEVLAFGVRTIEEIRITLGYAEQQAIHSLLKGDTETLPAAKGTALNILLKQTAKEREEQRVHWLAAIEEELGITQEQIEQRSRTSVEVVVREVTHEAEIVANLVTTLSLVLDSGGSESGFSEALLLPKALPRDRIERIRAQVSDDQIDRLMSLLDGLRY